MATITAKTGAAGNFSAGTSWVGGVAPTAADDAVLPVGTTSMTIDAGSVCRSLTTTAFTGTLTHTAGVTLTIGDGTAGAGNVALAFGAFTYTLGDPATSAISFISTSVTAQTVNFNGKTTGNVTFNGSGGSWKLTGAHNTGITATVTLTIGTLDVNGQTCSWGLFSSTNSNIRTLTLGAANITISGSGTAWNMTVSTNLTFNANTSNITCTTTAASLTFAGGGLTYNTVSITTNQLATFSGVNTFANFTFTTTAGSGPNWILQGNQTITGLLTLTGVNSATLCGRVGVAPSTPGVSSTRRILTAASVSLTNVDFAGITAAGAAAPFTGTQIGDAGGNTNITTDAPRTLYWIGFSGGATNTLANWSLSDGGASAASCPLPQDDAIFTANSITSTGKTVTVASTRWLCKKLDFSAVLNSPALSISSFNCGITGDLILKSGMTTNSSTAASLTLLGTGNQLFDPQGVTLFNIQINPTTNGSTGKYTLQSNLVIASAQVLTLVMGTFDANGFTVSTGSLSSSNVNARTLNMGLLSAWTLSGTGTIWNTGTTTNLTLNAQTSTIAITDTSITDKTFTGGGKTYNNLSITATGTGKVIFSDGNIFNALTINPPKTVQFTISTTTTIANLVAVGSSGNIITITSSIAGTPFTFSRSSGVISCDWLSLKDSTATGVCVFYAGANTANVSGNTGWIFTAGASTTTVTDAITPTEVALLKAIALNKSASLSLTESIIKSLVKTAFSESVSLSETLLKSIAKAAFVEGTPIYLTTEDGKFLTDELGNRLIAEQSKPGIDLYEPTIESLKKSTTRGIQESVSPVEVFTKSIAKAFSATLTLTESLLKATVKTLRDTILFGESFDEHSNFAVLLTDSINLVELLHIKPWYVKNLITWFTTQAQSIVSKNLINWFTAD